MARKRIPKLPSNPFNKGGGGHASSSHGPPRQSSRQPAEPVGPTPLPGGSQSFQRPPPIPEPQAPRPVQAPIIPKKRIPEITPEPTIEPVQSEPEPTSIKIEVEDKVEDIEESSEDPKTNEELMESEPNTPEPIVLEASKNEIQAVKQVNRAPPSAAGSKRSLGLASKTSESIEKITNDVSDDERVSKLLERSRKSSKGQGPETADLVPTTNQTSGVGTDLPAVRRSPAPQNAFKKPPVRRPQKQRRRRPQPQPAVRQKRLDRSRHVEYKYEVRGLMAEINVPEEHRSSLLGSIWAKGERQDVGAAKDFLREQHEAGKIDDSMLGALLKVVKRYTVRR
jgi:hypothetical protein